MSAIRLKLLRKQLGMSLQDLAEKTGLTKSYLSKLERGLSTPSIAVALKLSSALHMDVERLFSEEAVKDGIVIVKATDRIPLGRRNSPLKSDYEVIVGNSTVRHNHTFIVTPAFDFSEVEFKEHEGQEFLFVHKGRIEINFASQLFVLSIGDAVYFDAHIPHKIRSLGAHSAQVLVVISSS
jgi:transcriptional regulator with XRE-family HTH domain